MFERVIQMSWLGFRTRCWYFHWNRITHMIIELFTHIWCVDAILYHTVMFCKIVEWSLSPCRVGMLIRCVLLLLNAEPLHVCQVWWIDTFPLFVLLLLHPIRVFYSFTLFCFSSVTYVLFPCASLVYLGFDNECPVSSNGDLLLHDAEAVELADEHARAVQPQAEVHVVTAEAVLVIQDVLASIHIEKKEVMQVTSGERLPVFIVWNQKKKTHHTTDIDVIKLHMRRCVAHKAIILFWNNLGFGNTQVLQVLTLQSLWWCDLLTCDSATGPLSDSTESVVGQVWTALHVLQELLQWDRLLCRTADGGIKQTVARLK